MNESTRPDCYRFDRFELQPGERRLTSAGVQVLVEPRAFDVLVALVERAGHLVTKEELFSLVWPKLVVEGNNLQVQISALRKILGPAAIDTVSGRGYRFGLEVNCESLAPGAAGPTPNDTVRRQPSPHWRPQWVASGIAVLLIAVALVWRPWAAETRLQTAARAEPPPLSIAILPLSAPDDEDLAATIAPEITAALGRNARSVWMASPGLVASYTARPVDARAIGREVNVRYVVEGEIWRLGDAPFLSARLIDTSGGAQVWSDRFDLPTGANLLSRDAFATRISARLWNALVRAEQDRVARQSPSRLNAVDFWLRGRALDDESLENALAARKLYERALQLDPRLVGAMQSLAYTYGTELDANPQADGDKLRQDLEALSLRAIATDRADTRAWLLRGYALTYNARWAAVLEATAEVQRIEPNHTGAFGQSARALIALGRSEEALAQANRGLALDPSGPDVAFLLRQKCKAVLFLGQYQEAAATCEKAAVMKELVSPYIFLTAAFAQQGEMDKAALAKSRLLKLNPGYSIAEFRRLNVAPDLLAAQQAETHVIPGLRKAGVRER